MTEIATEKAKIPHSISECEEFFTREDLMNRINYLSGLKQAANDNPLAEFCKEDEFGNAFLASPEFGIDENRELQVLQEFAITSEMKYNRYANSGKKYIYLNSENAGDYCILWAKKNGYVAKDIPLDSWPYKHIDWDKAGTDIVGCSYKFRLNDVTFYLVEDIGNFITENRG